MPEISYFLGIVIRMYIREHVPTHCHAEYGEYELRPLQKGSFCPQRYSQMLIYY